MDTIPVTKKDLDTAVDKLADMIGEGFAQNNKRFDALEAKVGRIENLENEIKRPKDGIAI